MRTNYFVGYRTAPRIEMTAFLPTPKAPKNYKKEEAIQEYVEKALAERVNVMAQIPFLSTVVELAILDEAGRCLLSTSQQPQAPVYRQLCEWLLAQPGEKTLFGFAPQRMFDTAVAELFCGENYLSVEGVKELRLSVECWDILSMTLHFITPEQQELLTPQVIMLAVGLIPPVSDMAEIWAMAALNLAAKLRLV